MLRCLPVLMILVSACQSTARRVEKRSTAPDETTRPQSDDNGIPESANHPTMPPAEPGNETETEEKIGTDTGTTPDPESGNGSMGPTSTSTVVISNQTLEGNPNLPYGPLVMTGGETSWMISRDQYVISWNPNTRNPNWVAWKLSQSDLGSIGRQGRFSIDPDVEAFVAKTSSPVQTVRDEDYTHSCFDRGHMVASSDRQASLEDNSSTFFMSNIIPQTAFNNQRIWKSLEDQAKKWVEAGTHKNLWIVSGPVYDEKIHYISETNRIAIPSATFKLIYSWNEFAADKPFLVKAILVPNMTSNGTLAYEDRKRLCAERNSGGQVIGEPILKPKHYKDYVATPAQIEAAAHIQLPTPLR